MLIRSSRIAIVTRAAVSPPQLPTATLAAAARAAVPAVHHPTSLIRITAAARAAVPAVHHGMPVKHGIKNRLPDRARQVARSLKGRDGRAVEHVTLS